MQAMDLKCVGVEEGTGANAGKLGAIVVEFPAPDGNTYNVSVGSGFLLEEREKYWAQPDLIIDKIVEVQYFEVSQNQQGGYSLRFPVFKWIREDKDEVSVY
jgi:DNA ligase-1